MTIIEAAPRPLISEEPFAADAVQKAFDEMGIKVLLDVLDSEVNRENGEATVSLNNGETILSDEILVATGRRTAPDTIGLDIIGLEPGKFIEVDDQMRATGIDGE